MEIATKELSFLPTVTIKSLRNSVILNAISERRKRKRVRFTRTIFFTAGDILAATFWKRCYIYRFEGICISKNKKALISPEASLILRNVLLGVGIEFTISYYYSRVYELHVLDYKRKKFVYKRSKLYYIRQKLNRASRVK